MQYAEVAELADAQASGACGSNTVWVQVPSSALETRKASRMGCFFCFQEAAPLEPVGSRSHNCEAVVRSVRREKGPLDLFLFPSHPIFRISVAEVQGLAFGSVGAKQVPPAPSAPSSALKEMDYRRENSLPI